MYGVGLRVETETVNLEPQPKIQNPKPKPLPRYQLDDHPPSLFSNIGLMLSARWVGSSCDSMRAAFKLRYVDLALEANRCYVMTVSLNLLAAA